MADDTRLRALRSTFFEVAPQLSCIASETHFIDLGSSWEQVLGFTRDELMARPYLEFAHPDDRLRTDEEASQMVDLDRRAMHFVNRYRTRFGSYRTLEWNGAFRDGHFHAAARDITGEISRARTLCAGIEESLAAGRIEEAREQNRELMGLMEALPLT